MKNAGVKKFNNFHVIDAETEIEFEDAEVSFFKTTHSIPESMGIVLGTDQGILSIQVTSSLTKLPVLTTKLI